nr:GNAT family N-acetyltransferase [Coleofasciculus sp. FACHB-T130]
MAYPLFRLGIYEDLRNRLRLIPPNYICLAAVAPGSTNQGRGEDSSPSPKAQERQGTNADSVVGTVEMGLRPCSWQPWSSQYPYISNLAVHRSCRRRGVAQQLLLRCERTAVEWGFCDLYLHVLENNHQARQLYLKAGYHLHHSDPSWSDWLLRRPRRLFLHKHLPCGS